MGLGRDVDGMTSFDCLYIHRVLQYTMQVPVLLGFSSAAQLQLQFTPEGGSWQALCSRAPPCEVTLEQKENCILNYITCKHDSDSNPSCQVCFCHDIRTRYLSLRNFCQCMMNYTFLVFLAIVTAVLCQSYLL